MSKTAPVIIGGEEYLMKPLVFAQMRKAWPLLRSHMNAPSLSVDPNDPESVSAAMDAEIKAMEDGIKIISIALRDPDKTPEWIEENLLAAEMQSIKTSIMELLDISGLLASGNAQAELEKLMTELTQAPTTSTETSTQSSDTSLPPDAKAEAGT